MKIALFGATGMIGQRILSEALQRGHEVTAIARTPEHLARQENARLQMVQGNILDPASVAEQTAGHDAVISAFGPRDEAPQTVIEAARSLITGMTRSGVKRLVVVGGAGSLTDASGQQLVDAPDFPEGWKPVALAHRDALECFRQEAGALDWVYVSPAALIHPGERTGTYRQGKDQLLTDAAGNSEISAEDYAVAILDEVERPQHHRERMTVAY